MDIIAIIPAAGKGSRYGMPKVDANYNGISFAERITYVLALAGIEKIALVRDVETPDMLASIRYGMEQALAEYGRPDGWLIFPVDHPSVTEETVKTLAAEFSRRRNSIIIPRHNGKSGHPVILPGSFVIKEEANPLGLKGLIINSAYPVHYVEVEDEGILRNFNTPEDVIYV
jgi:CTP:molybdopterin cytidylyltransferase MocA